ncbi:MAG: GNAT family N-acetyltransferase [Steroidobacteraceae bacterium]
MQLEFLEADLQRRWRDRHGDEPVPVELASGQIKLWECLHDSQAVGHCTGNLASGEILGLSVLPSHRGQGVGRKQLSLAVDCLRAAGANRIWLAAPADPAHGAYGFYRALGWVATGERSGDRTEILELPANWSDRAG